jgi:hypothetical protein
MRFVELKSQQQLDMQTLHRSRERLVAERTGLINQLRAILLERGIVVPKGKRNLEQCLAALLDAHNEKDLSPQTQVLIADVRAQWLDLDRRIAGPDGNPSARLAPHGGTNAGSREWRTSCSRFGSLLRMEHYKDDHTAIVPKPPCTLAPPSLRRHLS